MNIDLPPEEGATLTPAVLPFAPALERKRRLECLHAGGIVVADNEASLVCKSCKAELDPWWVLRRIAHEHEKLALLISEAKRERQRLGAEVEELKRERSNLRAQVRRAQMKLEP